MIVSKPKVGTLFSISIFLIIAFGLFIYGLLEIQSAENRTWWMLLIYTSGPIGMVVLIKVLFGIRIFKIGKEKFEIHFPFKFTRVKFDGKEIDQWKYDAIKTYGGLYEEIILRLKSGKKYTISKQEHTQFDKALKYMKSKFKKLEA